MLPSLNAIFIIETSGYNNKSPNSVNKLVCCWALRPWPISFGLKVEVCHYCHMELKTHFYSWSLLRKIKMFFWAEEF